MKEPPSSGPGVEITYRHMMHYLASMTFLSKLFHIPQSCFKLTIISFLEYWNYRQGPPYPASMVFTCGFKKTEVKIIKAMAISSCFTSFESVVFQH